MNNDFVKNGYNKIAEAYTKRRAEFGSIQYLQQFNKLLKSDSLVLDLGCGGGKPADKFFVNHGHKIVGIDISEKQIELAKKNVPRGEFKVEDLSQLTLDEYKVDAVVSFYAIFHTKRETHEELFKKINSFLPKDGLILVTMGSTEWEGTEENFHGTKMFWSHFGAEKNLKMIKDSGFKIIFNEIDESGGEKHQIIIAKKL